MKTISLCSKCIVKDRPEFVTECIECKSKNLNHIEVFVKDERKEAKILLNSKI